jgi:hypothetical protein
VVVAAFRHSVMSSHDKHQHERPPKEYPPVLGASYQRELQVPTAGAEDHVRIGAAA